MGEISGKKKEYIIRLSVCDRYRHLHKIEEKIPSDAEIILLPEFDKELKEYNLKIGKDMESRGEKVVFITIKSIRPKAFSRIEKVELTSMVQKLL